MHIGCALRHNSAEFELGWEHESCLAAEPQWNFQGLNMATQSHKRHSGEKKQLNKQGKTMQNLYASLMSLKTRGDVLISLRLVAPFLPLFTPR